MEKDHVHSLSQNHFCAGVRIQINNRLLFTLSKPDIWTATDKGTMVPVAWVGGKPHAGESAAECAIREAEEELGMAVTLQSSRTTYVAEEGLIVSRTSLNQALSPFLIDRYRSDDRGDIDGDTRRWIDVPIYNGMAVGKPQNPDVPGILGLRPSDIGLLMQGCPASVIARRQMWVWRTAQLPSDSYFLFKHRGPERALAFLWQGNSKK